MLQQSNVYFEEMRYFACLAQAGLGAGGAVCCSGEALASALQRMRLRARQRILSPAGRLNASPVGGDPHHIYYDVSFLLPLVRSSPSFSLAQEGKQVNALIERLKKVVQMRGRSP